MLYAYLAFRVCIDHPSIRPTVFQWSLAVCTGPVAGSDSGSRKTNRHQRATGDGIEQRTSVPDLPSRVEPSGVEFPPPQPHLAPLAADSFPPSGPPSPRPTAP